MGLHGLLSQSVIDSQLSFAGHSFQIAISWYGVGVVATSMAVYWVYMSRLSTRKTPPPVSAWVLWLVLDTVAAGAEFSRGVLNLQMITYSIGTLFVCLVLIFSRQLDLSWKWSDTATAIFVAISIIVWYQLDPFWGLICSLTGLTVAAWPLMRDIRKGSDEKADIWIVFFAGCLLSIFDGFFLSGMWMGIVQLIMLWLILEYGSGQQIKKIKSTICFF